jgi:negative regulator of flagellin synthesis FlgM
MAVNLKGLELNGAALGTAHKTVSSQQKAADSQDTSQTSQSQPAQSEVSITSTASTLAQAQQSLAGQPAVNQSRVDAISNALANGTYKIDPDKIAAGLLQSERSLEPLARQEI